MVDATAVTYTITGSGSVSETVFDALHRTCWAEDFGALANSSYDDASAIQAAFNAGYQLVMLQSNRNYTAKSKITLPNYGVIACPGQAQIVQAYNGLVLDMSASACGLRNVKIAGDAASYPTAGGIVISGATSQFIDNGGAVGFGGYALEFVGLESGTLFRATTCELQSLNAATSVKMPSASGGVREDTGGREFIGCGALGTKMIDLAASANTRVIGGSTTGMLYSQNTTRSVLDGVRLALSAPGMTIDGVANQVIGCEIGGDITLASTAIANTFNPSLQAINFTIKDLCASTGDNLNDVYGQRFNLSGSNVVWSQASGTGPTLGNGSISGRFNRAGRRVSVDLTVVPGSTTTYGDGSAPWTFTLGSGILPPNAKARTAAIGSALGFNAGVSFETGAV